MRGTSRSVLRTRHARISDILRSGLLGLFAGDTRSGCATLLLFLLPGLSCHLFLLSRLVIVEFRHGLSVVVEVGLLTVAIPGPATAERDVGMAEG